MKIPSNCRLISLSLLMLASLSGRPAMAQEIGLWGGWNEHGRGWQGTAPRARPNAPRYGLFSDGSVEPFPALMDGGPRPRIQRETPESVWLPNNEEAGTILIDNAARRLYFTLDKEFAYEYPISVGRDGFTWTGTETVSRVARLAAAARALSRSAAVRIVGLGVVARLGGAWAG